MTHCRHGQKCEIPFFWRVKSARLHPTAQIIRMRKSSRGAGSRSAADRYPIPVIERHLFPALRKLTSSHFARCFAAHERISRLGMKSFSRSRLPLSQQAPRARRARPVARNRLRQAVPLVAHARRLAGHMACRSVTPIVSENIGSAAGSPGAGRIER
jgi:hypothetical protein